VLDVGCSIDSGRGRARLEEKVTSPAPAIGTPSVERVTHAVGRLRLQLFAYQLVVSAELT
jgi:hypothetical protein